MLVYKRGVVALALLFVTRAVSIGETACTSEKEHTGLVDNPVDSFSGILAEKSQPGNYFRREIGRPSEHEVLTCRIIDRPLRPLFPKGWRCETQVIGTVLSADQQHSPDVLAITGASAALMLSDIPFDEPVAGGRVGYIDGRYLLNPTESELKKSAMDIVVACTGKAIVMVEGKADELSEDEVLGGIFYAFEHLQPLVAIQRELQKSNGKEKIVVAAPEIDSELLAKVEQIAAAGMEQVYTTADKQQRSRVYDALKEQVLAELDPQQERTAEIAELLSSFKKSYMRQKTVNTEVRIGGRKFTEIRNIDCEVAVLPRTHGSSLFTRGETQALVSATLGSERDKQRVETLNGEEAVRFMLHYNFPPYCVGEARMLRGPSRRDIGHGNLATRGLAAVLPDEADFPYSIRVVSEIMESNGSSSMASVCGGSMAMMDAGVPIRRPVSGIAMGLIKEGDKVAILSDILGDEDHLGDMDFKVVGTCDGITALQMDIKIDGVDRTIMSTALAQARDGRMHILSEMEKGIAEAREAVSDHAPKYMVHKINPDKIRDIIGPGGKIIKDLSTEFDAKIEVDDDGLIKIFALNGALGEALLNKIKAITAEPEIGETYHGVVKSIKDFGAFVEILPGTDGLVHISELDHKRVAKVTDILNEGDKVDVKVLDVDNRGRIRLSRKALLEKEE